MKIVLYGTRTCGFSRSAEALLRDRGIEFERVDVTGDSEARAWLREATGRSTVPQIFFDGVPIGGYTDLAALDRAGKLP